MYHGVRDALDAVGINDRLDELIKIFAEKTIKDERAHFLYRIQDFVGKKIPLDHMKGIDDTLRKIFWVKLVERNAQFGYVYSVEQLRQMAVDYASGRAYVQRYISFVL